MESDKKKRHFAVGFMLAGIATSGACIGSNPMEVVKTRLQLQGELKAKGNAVVYRNSFHAFRTILQKEGIRGIQRGLIPGMVYQTFMNGTRLGVYEPLQEIFGANDSSRRGYTIRNIGAGATAGAIGSIFGSPFFLVKARIQASSVASTNLNAQYAYKGMVGLFQCVRNYHCYGRSMDFKKFWLPMV